MLNKDLGKIESIHGIAPAILQRAIIVIALSFVFFLAMLIAFSLRLNIGYFLLATAFLLIKLFTLFSFMKQRKKVVTLYENGLAVGSDVCFYKDISSINERTIVTKEGKKIALPESVQGISNILERINLGRN